MIIYKFKFIMELMHHSLFLLIKVDLHYKNDLNFQFQILLNINFLVSSINNFFNLLSLIFFSGILSILITFCVWFFLFFFLCLKRLVSDKLDSLVTSFLSHLLSFECSSSMISVPFMLVVKLGCMCLILLFLLSFHFLILVKLVGNRSSLDPDFSS